MAKKGGATSNPVIGDTIIWIETAKDTNGKYLKFDYWLKPKCYVPVRHFHPEQDEIFEIHKGTLKVECGGEIIFMKEGETLRIPKGVPHQWWNESETETVKLYVTFEPALNTEIFFEQIHGLGREGKSKPDGSPKFLQLMAFLNEYQMYIPGPPLLMQKIMGFVLGGIGQLLGYKKYDPRYSDGYCQDRS